MTALWMIVVTSVLVGIVGGWELWRWLRLKQSNRTVTAIHAAARKARMRQVLAEPGDRDVIGETLVTRIHEQWDPNDSQGPSRIVRKVQ